MKRYESTQDNLARSEESAFSPSEFMRFRHPDLFSDSEVNQSISLSREVFEYCLDTLTNRKQELEFEHFCRKLAEKEICPNLIPQTGPIGGGDSQVDAETYPVSDNTALCWYEGIGRKANSERWAFAFSAKKDWKPKVDSDIEKIVNTKRDYKLAYFITNQFIKDKTRAEKEKNLKDKYNIEVCILDRTWIVKCVFEHDRLWLAIETLNISGYKKEDIKRIGPKDTQREEWLKELEEQINNPSRYPGFDYQKVEDCYEAALIAREMELPRIEVEGRFHRAIENAEYVNIKEQKLQIVYNFAWTEYWWYEDYESFNHLYDKVEELVVGSAQADDIELLVNLWGILNTAVQNGLISAEDADLSRRIQTIKEELDRLINDEKRPNNALQAQTNKLFIDLTESLFQNKPTDQILEQFIEVIKKSKGLLEYPLLTTVKIIQELGVIFSNSPKYDELLNVVIDVIEKRTSEGQAGLLLLERGKQQIRSRKYYDAIKYIGNAQVKLAKDEYTFEWITSIVLCGLAYEEVGLFWAARANLLMAISHAFTNFSKTGNLKTPVLRYIQRLAWLEIKLGRFPYALSWIGLSTLVFNMLVLDDDYNQEYLHERTIEDQILAILLIKTDFSELKLLEFFPTILKKMDLAVSWMTLLYVLGYEDLLRNENVIPPEEDSDTVCDLFSKLFEQPVCKELPDHPDYLSRSTVTLVSPVLGCKVNVTAPNNNVFLFLAENIIGALEAFLATSFYRDLIPYRSEIDITIVKSDFLPGLPEYVINQQRQGEIIIRCPKIIQKTNSIERKAYRDWLQKIIFYIACQIVVIPDIDSFVDKVIKDERSFDRAILFSDVEFSISNILGEKPKVRLSDWENSERIDSYPLRRETPWDNDIHRIIARQVEKNIESVEGEIPEFPPDMNQLSHKDRKVLSLINIPLWNKAKWLGMGFVCIANEAPILALGFANPNAANQIFSEWNDKLGDFDEENKLHIAIIMGINRLQPYNYKVLISTNPTNEDFNNYKLIIQTSRCNEMFPKSPTNLNNFLAEYKRAGKFVLVPSIMDAEKNMPRSIGKYALKKDNLVIKQAWEIGPNDQDVMAIHEGDDPFIPKGLINSPVSQVLKRFEKRKK